MDETTPLRDAYQMMTGARLPSSKQISTLWVGGIGGMEAQIVRRLDVPYQEIPAAGLHGVGWKRLPSNVLQIGRGIKASQNLLRSFQPHVILFTGGYLAFPMAIAARFGMPKAKRPSIVLYVPDIEPALALKVISPIADRINVTTEESRRYFPADHRLKVSGYPLRAEHYAWATHPQRKENACQVFQLDPQIPIVLVFGGSKGARSINQALLAILVQLLEFSQVIHVSGYLDWDEVQAFQSWLKTHAAEHHFQRYRPFPYLHEEMSAAFAAADLAVCRAGASVLGELPLFGLPAILVPYPHAWRYQQVNAEYLSKKRAVRILKDSDLPFKLLDEIRALLENPQALTEMRVALNSLAQPFAAYAVAESILQAAMESRGQL